MEQSKKTSESVTSSARFWRTLRLAGIALFGVGVVIILFRLGIGRDFFSGNGMEMIWVEPLHGWVGKYLVTQEEWQKVMGDNPSIYPGKRRPVERVSWDDAQAYCRKLTEADHAARILPAECHYQLPTDRQYDIFVGDASLKDSVTSIDHRQLGTAEVGSKHPNQYGLYDTRGNLWEWCEDWYQNSMNDPQLVAKFELKDGGGKRYRVRRGGAWSHDAHFLPTFWQLSFRYGDNNYNRSGNVGFRCVVVKR